MFAQKTLKMLTKRGINYGNRSINLSQFYSSSHKLYSSSHKPEKREVNYCDEFNINKRCWFSPGRCIQIDIENLTDANTTADDHTSDEHANMTTDGHANMTTDGHTIDDINDKRAMVPCVSGNCLAKTIHGYKLVSELKHGDIVCDSDNNMAKVVCVLKTFVKHNMINMHKIKDLVVTSWHPVRIQGEWQYPADYCAAELENIEWVYNFVLNRNHVMEIGGIDVITLGHGITEDPVLSHDLFGTQRVVDNLRTYLGWNHGFIEAYEYIPEYDADNNIIHFELSVRA